MQKHWEIAISGGWISAEIYKKPACSLDEITLGCENTGKLRFREEAATFTCLYTVKSCENFNRRIAVALAWILAEMRERSAFLWGKKRFEKPFSCGMFWTVKFHKKYRKETAHVSTHGIQTNYEMQTTGVQTNEYY